MTPPFDYPAAARSIALSLAAFCDDSKPYPEMIAGAARQASERIAALTAEQWQREPTAVTEFAMYLTQFPWMPRDERKSIVANYLAARAPHEESRL